MGCPLPRKAGDFTALGVLLHSSLATYTGGLRLQCTCFHSHMGGLTAIRISTIHGPRQFARLRSRGTKDMSRNSRRRRAASGTTATVSVRCGEIKRVCGSREQYVFTPYRNSDIRVPLRLNVRRLSSSQCRSQRTKRVLAIQRNARAQDANSRPSMKSSLYNCIEQANAMI